MGIGLQSGQIVLNSVPDHVEADAVAGMAQPVAEPANVRQWLPRQQSAGTVAEAKGRFANPLQAALDGGVAHLAVRLQGVPVPAGEIRLNSSDVVEDVA
ncbi:MAG TPA: hypothetical protein VGI78_01870 [Acetobacteraceae bacterium]